MLLSAEAGCTDLPGRQDRKPLC